MSTRETGGGRDRLRAVALAAVMLLAVVAMAPVGFGAASDGPAESLTLDADPATANADSTHTWAFDDVDFEGEVDTISVSYPDETSLDGLTDDDVTVTLTRTLSSGEDTSEISVNQDSYAGNAATFDLSGLATTDIAGEGSVVIDGVVNPDAGEYEPTITLTGDEDEVTVTADVTVDSGDDADDGNDADDDDGPATGLSLTADPAAANADSTHTWAFDDVDFEGQVDEIVADYPDAASFDGLTNDDVTVTLTRTLSSGEDTSEISVNQGSYDGSAATFDLSGVATTDIAGEGSVVVEGVENPDAGEYEPTLTFVGEEDEVTVAGDLVVGEDDPEPGDELAATITDGDGDPLADTDVVVTLDGADDATDGEEVVEFATTDADGAITVEAPVAGAYDATVTTQEAGEASETVEVDGETTATFAVIAGETGALDALVTDADGDPLTEGTWVTLSADDFAAPLTGQVDADGVLSIEGVAPGEYDVTAETVADGGTDPVSVSVDPGETATTEFTYGEAPTTATLSGTVTDADGEPVADETVVVAYDALDGDASDGATVVETDADGGFAVDRVALGTYEVTVTSQDSGESDPVTVDLGSDETADVTLTAPETGTLEGTVTDADGESLAAGTWVTFSADSDAFGPDRTVQVSDDGTFALTDVPPGSLDVVAETLDFGTTEPVSFSVTADETTTTTFTYDETPDGVDEVRLNSEDVDGDVVVGPVDGDVVLGGDTTVDGEVRVVGDVAGDVIVRGAATVEDVAVEGDVAGDVRLLGSGTVSGDLTAESADEVAVRGNAAVAGTLAVESVGDVSVVGSGSVGALEIGTGADAELVGGSSVGAVSVAGDLDAFEARGGATVDGDVTLATVDTLRLSGGVTVAGDLVADEVRETLDVPDRLVDGEILIEERPADGSDDTPGNGPGDGAGNGDGPPGNGNGPPGNGNGPPGNGDGPPGNGNGPPGNGNGPPALTGGL
ncbi:cytoskeletal protein CcmA (bactofilin family) [Halorubrum alkaliphilum]|uniref:Cytoskeletal protein CcmA (Bactofilin family) n=1 Tax=Halorubrum alkaliphilum TaxID=261290 RepID=A0A8T4GEX1_9EURY|nr:carboxypeptidase regulatory-like domain-containing protein [Halorubrum alkaliphilum]MBP1923048.1 cytoskeletal protein CcmA (bactofilin family) [Halorubrum alkaliphilum]